VDQDNPLCNAYKDKLGNIFYVEPSFYMGLKGYEDKREKAVPLILKGMDEAIKKNHKVIFVGEFDNPFMIKEGFVYLELSDITDPLHLTWIDDSRPSDYGD
jgi:hypothetical protein